MSPVGRVAVETGHARLRKDTADLPLDLLGTRAEIFHPRALAGRTRLGRRGRELTIVALQQAIVDVKGQGHAAPRALADEAAIMTLHERGVPPPIQEQQRLLPPCQARGD